MTGKRPATKVNGRKDRSLCLRSFCFEKVHKKQAPFSTAIFEIYPHRGIDFLRKMVYNMIVAPQKSRTLSEESEASDFIFMILKGFGT